MSGPTPAAPITFPPAIIAMLKLIESDPVVAAKFAADPTIMTNPYIAAAVAVALPPTPKKCFTCSRDGATLTKDSHVFCSAVCTKDYDERCMFCCYMLPTTPITNTDGKFCKKECHEKYIWGTTKYRKCTCGGHVNKENIKIYDKGHVHCSEKCKKAWQSLLANPTPAPAHYVGFFPVPFMSTGMVPVVRRIPGTSSVEW